MPIGGSNIGWDSTVPADTESAGLGDDRIRSLKTSVQEALANEHNFAVGGGANTGYHLLGSARPFFGAQSLVSSTGSDGRLMLTSDTSALFGVGSGGTVLLGGPTVLSAGSFPGTVPQRHYWAVEFGEAKSDAIGVATVTFPNSGFSGLPYTQATAGRSSQVPRIVGILFLPNPTATSVSFGVWNISAASVSNYTVNWFSIGTRVL